MTAADVLERMRPEFDRVAAPYTHRPSALLALLHAVQETYGHVSPEGEAAVAEFLGMGRNHVHEAVTFYTLYRRRPYGRHHVQVCRTLSCDVTGAPDLVALLRSKLGVAEREVTPDGLFSWETVECLGCCELAPAVQVNREPFRGPLTAPALASWLDELKAASGNGHAEAPR